MIAALALALLLAPRAPGAQDVGPTDPVLAARALLPAYEYEPTLVTTDAALAGVYDAVRLLEQASALEPERADLLWWLAHCHVLLGEERRLRADEAGARMRTELALALYDRAQVLQPDDAWTSYARGVALRQSGRAWEALDAFRRTSELATTAAATAAEGEPRDTLLWIDLKARQFRADALLALFKFEDAERELGAWFDAPDQHAWWVDKSTWTKSFELAGVHQRARDFAAVRALMEAVLANDEYAQFASPHEMEGYVSGLLGERERAVAELQRAADLEDPPGLYPRLWGALLAEGESAERARATLREFVDFPPPSLSPWDRALGRFALGDEAPEDFLARADAERARRIAAGEPQDDLECEAWFYVAHRFELDGDLERALDAYHECLAFEVAFKWEWEYARARLRALAQRAGRAADAGFTLEEGRVARVRPGSLAWRLGLRAGELRSARVHRPGELQAAIGLEALERALEPGDLALLVVRQGERDTAVPVVVGALR